MEIHLAFIHLLCTNAPSLLNFSFRELICTRQHRIECFCHKGKEATGLRIVLCVFVLHSLYFLSYVPFTFFLLDIDRLSV